MKKILCLVISITMLFTLVSCSGAKPANNNDANNAASAADTTEINRVKLTIGHCLADSHPQHQALLQMAEEAAKAGIDINVVANSALGTEIDMINQVATNALDACLNQGVSNFQGLDPRLAVEEIPFLFADRQEAYKAHDGAYGDRIAEIIKEHNINVLAYWENGFRHFTNNTRPIVEPKDMKGIKFRTAASDARLRMFAELGSNAVPMAFNEVFTALQQGTIDGQENPLSTIDTSKFYEVQKYLSLSGHIWSASLLIIGDNALNKLSDEQKKVLQDLTYKYRDIARKTMTELDEKLINSLEEKGMKVNKVNVEAFQKATQGVREWYIEKNGDELLKLAEQSKK